MEIPPPIRPTFDHATPMTETETVASLRAVFEADGEHPIQIVGKHVTVTVPARDRHFWSPYLNMDALEQESGTLLHGRFSPKPSVWTGFMLGYICLTTAGCFGLMFGGSLAIIGRPSGLAFALALVFLLAAVGMYVGSQFGQRLARAQMGELHVLVLEALRLEDGAASAASGTSRATPAGEDRSENAGEVPPAPSA